MRRLVFLLAFTACRSVVAPFPGATPLEPRPIHRTWYAEVEACSGLRGSFDRIHFQVAEEIIVRGETYGGWWYPPHSIVIRADLVEREVSLKHEFMHDLLQLQPTGDKVKDHPAEYFNGLCGDLNS